MMQIEVDWLTSDEMSAWDATGYLYAYLNPKTDEILYIGHTVGKPIEERFDTPDKDDLFGYFREIVKINPEELEVIVGEIIMDEGKHLTNGLLAEIESLIIRRIQPPGNIQSKNKRISRPGMVVKCVGQWPNERKLLVDTD